MTPFDGISAALGAIVEQAVADATRPLVAVLAELRQVLEERNAGPVLLPTAEAARAGGFPSAAALRIAARRRPEIGAARVDRRIWDRARLIAAVGRGQP